MAPNLPTFRVSRKWSHPDRMNSSPVPIRVLPRPFDYARALWPLALCFNPWPVIQSRARCDLARLNRATGHAGQRGGVR